MAIDYGCTGPVLRGSGVDWDLRRDGEPIYTEMYDGYTLAGDRRDRRPAIRRIIPIRPCRREAVLGDCWHRYLRADARSGAVDVDLIRQAMEKYAQAAGRRSTSRSR